MEKNQVIKGLIKDLRDEVQEIRELKSKALKLNIAYKGIKAIDERIIYLLNEIDKWNNKLNVIPGDQN